MRGEPVSPESSRGAILRRLAGPLVLFLGVIYLGAGWRCEVDTARTTIVIAPTTVPWGRMDTADLAMLRTADNRLIGWIDTNDGPGYDLSAIQSFDEGASWAPLGVGPVLSRELPWERSHVTSPHVLLIDGTYHLWYSASSDPKLAVGYQIGYATSPDGIQWKKHPEPVLSIASSEGEDNFSIADPCVLPSGSGFRMWYSGAESFKGLPRFRIWEAWSEDGVNWTDRRDIVSDFLVSAAPHVERYGGTDHLWYSVATDVHAGAFQELRYRTRKWPFGFSWLPWNKQKVLNNLQLGQGAEHSLYSPWVDLKPDGSGWLYLSVHDNTGVWRVVRAPMEIKRAFFGWTV